MNSLKQTALKEYTLIKGLQIGVLTILGTLFIFILSQILQGGVVLMVDTMKSEVYIYLTFATIVVSVCGAIGWRWNSIPSNIKNSLESYYNSIGYTTKKNFLHVLKVKKSPNLYFKVKIHLYKRVSKESCIFHLESMNLPVNAQNKELFKRTGERFLLKSNDKHHKYSTSCELEEVHMRSLLMTRAIENFLQAAA